MADRRRPTLARNRDGQWVARLDLGSDWTGKRRQRWKTLDGSLTEREARRIADEWAEGKVGERDAPLCDALDRYIDFLDAAGNSPNTVSTYRTFARYVRNLAPRAYVSDMDPLAVEELEMVLVRRGGGLGRGGLSRSTVKTFHWFLRGAYRWMVLKGIAQDNPVRDVRAPTGERREAEPLCDRDLVALTGWARPRMVGEVGCGRRERLLAAACDMALATGCREGELLALRLRDRRPSMCDVHIGGTVVDGPDGPRRKERPKSSKGYRNVSLTPEDMADLQAYEGSLPWADGGLPLLSVDGSWLSPATFRGWFSDLRLALGLSRGVTFHTLRHTHATAWLMNGCDLKSLQERLGHEDFATTARIYGHVVPGRDAEGARAVRAALDAGTVGRVAPP